MGQSFYCSNAAKQRLLTAFYPRPAAVISLFSSLSGVRDGEIFLFVNREEEKELLSIFI